MSEKLKVVKLQDGIEIVGNREGLKGLAEICMALSNLSDTEATTPANHYHFADYMNNAEEGSVELTLLLDQKL
jgi:hypothetical protein